MKNTIKKRASARQSITKSHFARIKSFLFAILIAWFWWLSFAWTQRRSLQKITSISYHGSTNCVPFVSLNNLLKSFFWFDIISGSGYLIYYRMWGRIGKIYHSYHFKWQICQIVVDRLFRVWLYWGEVFIHFPTFMIEINFMSLLDYSMSAF